MRLLDLFCGAGGSAVGYYRAGFVDIVGVDINPQPRYPFRFNQDDVTQMTPGLFAKFDLIHASPPCQSYSVAMRHLAHAQPKLIDPLREMLKASGVPYIIENVPGAPLVRASNLFGEHGAVLCGTMFGLRVIRHRLFETSFPVSQLECNHGGEIWNPHRSESRERFYAKYGRQDAEIPWAKEMGVDWMKRYEAREAIPPAYTEYLGKQFLNQLTPSTR